MLSTLPKILALDFDGVVCDGLLEYFQTTKKAYEKIWKEDPVSLDSWAELFYHLRPVIETGWEMPLLLRALVLQESPEAILEDWPQILDRIVTAENLDTKYLAQTLDGVRDEWIRTDPSGWLKLHRFYAGVVRSLQAILRSGTKIYIISTKEGRFIQTLLEEQGINLASDYLIGKEVQQPKYTTLKGILKQQSCLPSELWFVEDRLKALELVAQEKDLEGMGLFLAAWGYNTEATRNSLQNHPQIRLLSLEQFTNWS
jgi:phosphoglycolate phosphatase-like HAD superfamily hydrolase